MGVAKHPVGHDDVILSRRKDIDSLALQRNTCIGKVPADATAGLSGCLELHVSSELQHRFGEVDDANPFGASFDGLECMVA